MAYLFRRFRCTCPSSHLHSPRLHKPPCDPGRSVFPSPVLASAPHSIYQIQPCLHELRLKCWHTYTPFPCSLPVPSSRENMAFFPVQCLDAHVVLGTAECPESLCQVWVLPMTWMTLKVISEDITLPSQLLRTHASDRIPPSDSVFPCTLGPCRLSPVPAGKRPFPTLSLQSLHRCLDPYSVVSPECACPLLPREHWPHAMGYAFGTQDYPCNATSTGRSISELQSFVYLQAPMLARPPGHTHR